MDETKALVYLVGFVIVALMIFAAIRELLCWYWKINDRLALLTEIRDHLAAIRGREVVDARIVEIKKEPRAQKPAAAVTTATSAPSKTP